jgi:hypothetical protein
MGSPHRLSHHPEQIDEYLTAKEVVDLLLARTVPLHQLLQLRRFVRRIVIDVKLWTTSETLANEIDEVLEHLLLGLTVLRPECAELWKPSFKANDAE